MNIPPTREEWIEESAKAICRRAFEKSQPLSEALDSFMKEGTRKGHIEEGREADQIRRDIIAKLNSPLWGKDWS